MKLFAILIAATMAAVAQVPTKRLHIPIDAQRHQRDMMKSAWKIFGLNAPTATLAAQIHQESGWNADAVSRVGASGLTQFMPATAQDIAKRFSDCKPADSFNPSWAITCRDRYMSTLLAAIPVEDECARWAYALRAYNGGLGWVRKDMRLAEAQGVDLRNWRAVARFNSGRSAGNWKENTEYPVRIIDRASLVYSANGWGRAVCYD